MEVSFSLRSAVLFFAVLFVLPSELAAAQEQKADSKAVAADLQKRTKQYLDFRKRVAGSAPRPTGTPADITKSQKKLADKIRVARAGVKQGAIFTPTIADFVRQQIAASLSGPGGEKVRTSLQHAEPVNITLQVNESYPEDIPLQSTPPSLLLNLPELPKGLEYRLVGRELVLRDVDANIIVDYVPNALPS